jgi:hypothetical protein
LGRRSRKRRPEPSTAPAAPQPGVRRPGRSEARNAAVRERLAPLAPGEHPPALVIASALAAVLAVANLALYAAGTEVEDRRPAVTGVVIFALLMAAAAWGMWHHRYWAVLGFEALLGITVVIAALSLLVASNVQAVVLCVVIIALGGTLFWKLVRVMARLQAPERGPRREVR